MIDLPFELDTIEAIQEAQSKRDLFIAISTRIGPFLIYLSCAACEYFAFTTVNSRLDIVCIAYREISGPAVIYLLTSYIPLLPDVAFAILGPISIFMIYNNPYGVMYNGVTGILCFFSGGYFHARMTFCGNPEQDAMILGPILLYISGFLHILNAVINHLSFMHLDKEGELYFGQLRDLIEDVCQIQ